jgi:hypothetical protein
MIWTFLYSTQPRVVRGDSTDMTRVPGEQETATKKSDTAAIQHRKPLPKGSDGSKPRARQHGEKPRPKKSGAMFDAHRPVEPATSSSEQDALEEHVTRSAQGMTAGHDSFEPVGDGPSKAASHNTTGSFLNSEQRQRVETLFVARVLAAQIAYTTVLSDMHADNLVKKPEELSIWTALFITVVGKVAEYAIMKALMDLKKVGTAIEKLKDAKVSEVKESEVEGKILGLHEKTVEGLVSIGVDKGKEKGTEKKTEAQNEAGQEEQGAKGSYITYLQDNSMMMFQHLREDRLSGASDAELLTMMVAYEGFRHSHSVYQAKLQAHIDLFMSSHAKDIGHRMEDGLSKLKPDETVHLRKETRVAWVINGRANKQLVYMAKEFVVDITHKPGPAYDASENALGAEETGTWKDRNIGKNTFWDEKTHAHEAEPEFLGPVEEELQQAALAAHEKRWLQAPEVLMKGPYGWIVVPQ